MFAYCNNSPVSHCDPNGYYVHTYNDKLPGLGIAEGIVDSGSGGGGFVPGCGGESGRRKSEIIIQREITYVTYVCEPIQKAIADTAVAVWDAYMRSYNIQQQMHHHQVLAQQELFVDIYCYVTDDAFWSTDVGIIVQSTIVSAGIGGAEGFAGSVAQAWALVPASPQAAVAIVGQATLTGFVKGAITGFVGGIVTVVFW